MTILISGTMYNLPKHFTIMFYVNEGRPGGMGGTPIYQLHRYVLPDRVKVFWGLHP